MNPETPAEAPDENESVAIDDGEIVETERGQAVLRRSPRYFRFMAAGAVLGIAVALILTVAFPRNDEFAPAQVFGFLLLFLAVIGVGVGALVALILDRTLAKKAATTAVEHSSTHPLD